MAYIIPVRNKIIKNNLFDNTVYLMNDTLPDGFKKKDCTSCTKRVPNFPGWYLGIDTTHSESCGCGLAQNKPCVNMAIDQGKFPNLKNKYDDIKYYTDKVNAGTAFTSIKMNCQNVNAFYCPLSNVQTKTSPTISNSCFPIEESPCNNNKYTCTKM